MTCARPHCPRDVAIVFGGVLYLCADCSRVELLERRFSLEGVRPLIRPLIDIRVVLRDREKPKGLIVIPRTAQDKYGRIKGSVEHATGIVLAEGPGYQARKKELTGPYINERLPTYTRVGQHVVFRSKFEDKSIQEWRGLSLVHDLSMIGEVIAA